MRRRSFEAQGPPGEDEGQAAQVGERPRGQAGQVPPGEQVRPQGEDIGRFVAEAPEGGREIRRRGPLDGEKRQALALPPHLIHFAAQEGGGELGKGVEKVGYRPSHARRSSLQAIWARLWGVITLRGNSRGSSRRETALSSVVMAMATRP